MSIVRNRCVKMIALACVVVHAYALVGHYGGMMQRLALSQVAGSSPAAEATVLAQISAATIMCRASTGTGALSSNAGPPADTPGDKPVKTEASCPICSGVAVAHALPPPSGLLIGQLVALVEIEPTAYVSIAHLTRDSRPPPRGPPSSV